MIIRRKLEKLVRSFFIDSEEDKAKIVISKKILNDNEFAEALMEKLHEEALEVINSESNDEIITEIADVYEVIDEIIRLKKISKDNIINAQQEKRRLKGGYEKRYYANYYELHKDHNEFEWYKNYALESMGRYPIIGEFDKHIVDFIIQDETKNKIYIQRRSANRKSYPNTWELPGGAIEIYETFSDCIRRELKEELNLDLTKINNMIYEVTDTFFNNNEIYAYTVFSIEVSNWQNFKLEEGKADEFQWIDKNQIEILNINRQNGETSPVFLAVQEFFKQNP